MVIDRPKLSNEQAAALDRLLRLGKQVQTLGGYAGCLSGDTVLRYNRGTRKNVRPITLRDMYDKFNGRAGSGRGAAQRWDPNVPTYLYALWPDGTVALNRVVGVLASGSKAVIRINFTDGSHLVLTQDHPVAVPGGEFVEAGTLSPGDSVLAVGDMRTKVVGRRPLNERPHRVVINTKYHPNGAVKVVTCNGISYTYRRVARARLVVEAAMNNVTYDRFIWCLKNDQGASSSFTFLDRGLDVHHVNEDPTDDDIGNLEVLPHDEHPKHHDPEAHFNREYVRELEVSGVAPAGVEMTYDIQMESPANNFEANGVFVHNTGKTTLIGELVRRLPGWKVCAFTGKAAHVLRRKGVAGAATIHSTIYVPVEEADGTVSFELVDLDHVGAAGFVVDEASMVSKALHDDLCSFGVPIIYVGDHGQLEPVGGGGFNLMAAPDVTLETVHRNAGAVARFAEHLRRGGEALDWAELGSDLGHSTGTTDNVVRVLTPNEWGEWQTDVPDQMICAYNKTRVALNRTAREHLGFPAGGPAVGDRIMCLQNDRKFTVFNGMQGEIVAINPEKGVLAFRADGTDRVVPYVPEQFGAERKPEGRDPRGRIPFDWCYAVTCHKAQGDEWDRVVVLEQRCGAWDHRRWAYTAASRARRELVWVAEGGKP